MSGGGPDDRPFPGPRRRPMLASAAGTPPIPSRARPR